jgi:transposase-like protein
VRQLIKLSGHSKNKLQRIKNYWLTQEPPALSNIHYKQAKYLIFDGTYFHQDGCLAILMDYRNKTLISCEYIGRESYHNVYPILLDLKNKGLHPKAITTDGHRRVINAIMDVWPSIKIQRCLFHIQNQGLMWIRTYPRTEAGKQLRNILKSLTPIKTKKDQKDFLNTYDNWFKAFEYDIKKLSKTSIANTDLKRTMSLINNALPNKFHFIKDRNIAPTTNILENLFSQLKHQYRSHRGLSQKHKIQYLKWYCYFKNTKK